MALPRIVLLGLACAYLTVSSADAAPLAPRALPAKPEQTRLSEGQSSERLVLKLAEGGGFGRSTLAHGSVGDVLSSFDVDPARVRRLFSRPAAELADERAVAQKRGGRVLADLNLYFRIDVPPGQNTAALADALNALASVELAYPESLRQPDPAYDLPPTTPDFGWRQTHRSAATGVAEGPVEYVPGIDGAGTTVVDIESGWQLDHEDLGLPPSAYLDTEAPLFGSTRHGTAVLGVIGGRRNEYGITGIAPDATMLVTSHSTVFDLYNPARAISLATSVLGPGDVILLEIATCVCFQPCRSDPRGPVEWDAAVFDAIEVATALGITVVEAAGNGDVDLDDPECQGRFDRTVRDSGAIIVGGGWPDRRRINFSSYGSRVDVQGWATAVTTAGYGHLFGTGDPRQDYTMLFSGTSSASAIVAGVALALQGASIADGQGPLSPSALRQLLVDTGRPQRLDGLPGHIGPLPHLPSAVAALLGTSVPVCSARDLGSPVSVSLDDSTAGHINDHEGSCGGAAASERTYRYTAPVSGTYIIDTCGSPTDTVLYVRDGDCAGPEIACRDDGCGSQSHLSLPLTAGQTISITVDGAVEQGSGGIFDLRISQDACGDGVLDPGEECDDANDDAGDCCSPDCRFEAAGSSCVDPDPCSVDDVCDGAGACLAGTTPLDCEDDDVCTQDSCVPGTGCLHDAVPAPDCSEGWGGGKFLLKSTRSGRDQLSLVLKDGPAMEQLDYGDPTTAGGTGYTFCLYADDEFKGRLDVDRAGESCGKRDCWGSLGGGPPGGDGFRYRDGQLSADGVQLLRLQASPRNKSKIVLKAKNNPDKFPAELSIFAHQFRGVGSVVTQMTADDTGACFERTFDEVLRTDSRVFEAK